MGERKVINKHYPQDFDPKKIRRLVHKNKQKNIRFMLPVRTRCNTCGNYMSEGTKFNSREEEADDMYLTVKIFRFYIKCNNCLAEIMIKTYPKSKCGGYTVESGATFPYNKQEEEEEEETETETAMESLEKRTIVCKREIQDMATLDEIKCLKSRRALVSIDSMLEALMSRRKKQEVEEEEEVNQEEELLIKSIKFGKRTMIDDYDDEEENNEKKKKKKKKPNIKIAKKKKKKKEKETAKLPMGLESLCQNYGTDSDDEVKTLVFFL